MGAFTNAFQAVFERPEAHIVFCTEEVQCHFLFFPEHSPRLFSPGHSSKLFAAHHEINGHAAISKIRGGTGAGTRHSGWCDFENASIDEVPTAPSQLCVLAAHVKSIHGHMQRWKLRRPKIPKICLICLKFSYIG